MTGKVIKKTIEYKIPKPNELFAMFKERFSKDILPDSWQALAPWTSMVLGIFDEIGRSQGFIPSKEYLRLDQTWEIRHNDISLIALALEHENTDKVEEILNDELQKLLDVKAFLKVLVFYPTLPLIMDEGNFTFPEFQEKINSEQIKHPEEMYLIIGIVYVAAQNVIEVSACVFDSEGKGEELEAFQISYTSKG